MQHAGRSKDDVACLAGNPLVIEKALALAGVDDQDLLGDGVLVGSELLAGLMEADCDIGVLSAHLGVQCEVNHMAVGHGPSFAAADAELATVFLNVFFLRHSKCLLF